MELSDLFKLISRQGIGIPRHGWNGAKGKGYFGELPNSSGGISTELSADNDEFSYPLLTPNLPQQDIESLLQGKDPTEEIYRLAEEHARKRRARGLSPFAQPNEFRFPFPRKE